MFTVKSLMTQLTDPKMVLQNVSDVLRKIDPNFAQEELQYLTAVEALKEGIGETVSPSASDYIAAREQEICAELIYVGWLGFQQNMECFQNPVNTMFLKMDYEDFHRERRMHTLPAVQQALKTINAFHDAMRALPTEQRDLTDGITSYISYLETTGYKLAHYFGFILADQFLGHVIPGYCSDPVTTLHYAWDLREYLKLELDLLD